MKEDLFAKLSSYLDAHRGHNSSTALVNAWLEEQFASPPEPDDASTLLYALSRERSVWRDGEFLTPQPLAAFIARLAELYPVRSVLDPTCGSGLLLRTVAAQVGAEVVHGIDIDRHSVPFATAVLGERATIICGDAFSEHEGILDHYDLIVADAPLGVRFREGPVVRGLSEAFRGDMGQALAVWACGHLSEVGAALIVVAPSFLEDHNAGRIHSAIADLGCRIRALLQLPGGTLRSTSMHTYLLVLERGRQQEIFVGQYADGDEHQSQLAVNFKRGKSGPQPALGRLCRLTEFRGFESFVARERLTRLARKAGWRGVPGAAVFTACRVLGEERCDLASHQPAGCYLRVAGPPIASLDPDELRPKRSGSGRVAVELDLAPEYADPRFMVHWFNTSEIGRTTLAAVSRGRVLPRVDLAALLESTIYLPTMTEQVQAVRGAASLARVRSEADELESQLWDGGRDVADVTNSIEMINREDRFEDWIETLPFPLASILWRHRTIGVSIRDRYPVLLHFFEATAAFIATVHVSAFAEDERLWSEHAPGLSRSLREQNLSLERASFGLWKAINERLGSTCGKMVGDPNELEVCRRVYGTPTEGVLGMLASSELRAILQRANAIRNEWGHGGAIGVDTAQKAHDELMELVARLRGIFGRRWSAYVLLQPGSCRYSNGVYHQGAKRLMGSRTSFEEIQIETTQALDSESLSLFDTTSQTSLRLQPFVKVMPSPTQRANACFFFNRRDMDVCRFVSYHFEPESSIEDRFPDVVDAIRRFHRFDADPAT